MCAARRHMQCKEEFSVLICGPLHLASDGLILADFTFNQLRAGHTNGLAACVEPSSTQLKTLKIENNILDFSWTYTTLKLTLHTDTHTHINVNACIQQSLTKCSSVVMDATPKYKNLVTRFFVSVFFPINKNCEAKKFQWKNSARMSKKQSGTHKNWLIHCVFALSTGRILLLIWNVHCAFDFVGHFRFILMHLFINKCSLLFIWLSIRLVLVQCPSLSSFHKIRFQVS